MRKKMEVLIRKIREGRGFLSVEACISIAFIMIVLLYFIGMFVYMYPKITLNSEVHLLAQTAKVQGGLTDSSSQAIDSDLELFYQAMEEQGYDRANIEVTAITVPGNQSVIGVTPLNGEGTNYASRKDKEKIEITVKIPAKKIEFLNLLGSGSLSDYYVFTETVMSERW